ncbi:hypothetical protein SD71_10330 [Cohnella kolymensis]|uniref:Atrophied bacterial Ig domain-containing protein n=2 Tax=Cohnella kolymensis TaxID=1590652 RepID=A0ABR5A4X6_9BACL|nr:hypothetical protein SD71_10330 [Cohnella kolymensis]
MIVTKTMMTAETMIINAKKDGPFRDATDKLIPSGTAVATDSQNNANLGNLFDNNSRTTVNFASQTPWIQYEFLSGKREAVMYTLTSGTAAGDPKSWVLQGSNDGSKWDLLDERSNESFQWRSFTRAFSIKKSKPYSFYRLEIVTNSGEAVTSLAEFELMAYPSAPLTDNQAVAETISILSLGDTSAVRKSLKLPVENFEFGTKISWQSSDTAVMTHDGRMVKRPAQGEPNAQLTFTATVTRGTVTQTKIFDVTVLAIDAADLVYEEGIDFATGLEAGDVMPNWNNQEIIAKNVGEFCCGIGGLESIPGTPGRDSSTAILYSGRALDAVENYSYNEMFDVDFDIKPTTVLSYWVLPQANFNGALATSKYVSVDLHFTDGTYLHDLGATDQHGIGLHPQQQGAGGKLIADQWNLITSEIGLVAAGKTVDRVMVSFNATGQTGLGRGFFDDIKIEHASSSTAPTSTFTALQGLIAEAQAVHDAAIEGNQEGQYPSGSKAALQAEITRAEEMFNNKSAAQADIDVAAQKLASAVEKFRAAVNTGSVLETPPGDSAPVEQAPTDSATGDSGHEAPATADPI